MGYLRFFLAISVVIEHLWADKDQNFATVAVFGFYCISGYLMTKIINETYGSTMQGKARFLINRFIRIFPPYYLCLGISLLCIYFTPDAHNFNTALTIPKSGAQWLRQLSIFGLNEGGSTLYLVRMLPTAWSLNTELVYYLGMSLIIGSSFSRTLAWSVISLGISIYLTMMHYSFIYHYFTLYNPSICFASAAMLYYIKPFMKRLPKLNTGLMVFIGFFMCYIPLLLNFRLDRDNNYCYLYMVIPIYLYIIYCLDNSAPSNEKEQLAADISYPLFLLHWPVGALFIHVLIPHSFLFWLMSISATLPLCWLVVRIEHMVFVPIRRKIRKQAQNASIKKTPLPG